MTLHDIPDNWQHADIEKVLRDCFPPLYKFDTAVDVGAHRGVVTRKLLQYFHWVIAIEPGPLADQIPKEAQVLRCGVAERSGSGEMRDGNHNTGQRYFVPGTLGDVPVTTLDTALLGTGRIDFIKIDTEGMEFAVLLGGAKTIRQHKPVIMFEENGLSLRYGYPRGAAGALLERWGYVRKMVLRSNPPDEDWVYVWPK